MPILRLPLCTSIVAAGFLNLGLEARLWEAWSSGWFAGVGAVSGMPSFRSLLSLTTDPSSQRHKLFIVAAE